MNRAVSHPLWLSCAEVVSKAKEMWKGGKRVDTAAWYLVPDPTATVVELAAADRKRT